MTISASPNRHCNEDEDYWGNDLCHCGDVEEPHHHAIPAIRSTEESKAAPVLNDFVDYCRRFPDLRFWQALQSFSGYDKIYGGTNDPEGNTNLEDTFHMTTKGPAISVPAKVTQEDVSKKPRAAKPAGKAAVPGR